MLGEARGQGAIEPARSVATRSTLAQEIAGAALLRGVDFKRVQALLEPCPVRQLEAGEVLISPGETDLHLYLLLCGRLRVHLATLENEPVAVLGVGQSVGELSPIDHQPRSAWVVAAEPSRVLRVDEAVFWRLVSLAPEVALNLLTVLSGRLRGNNSAITQSQRLQQEYKRHAQIDGLTGLYNRRWLDGVLPRQVRRSEIDGAALSLLMLDIDHFKRFNDDHGHQAGDFVLFAVARVMGARVRPTDLVARYGGEEFTIVLPQTELAGAGVVAERVRAAIADLELVMPDEIHLPSVTVSLGAAELAPGEQAAALLGRADEALYRAKAGGRDRVESAL